MEDSPTHAGFVHLRVHTAYSLSEGAIRIPQLIDMCRDYAMPAVAITDTDNLFGGLEFSAACAGGGVQPIIGCQVKLQRQRKGDARPGHVVADATDNLVLLVKDEEGYGNLLKLLGQAYLGHADEDDGPLEPHVTLDDLKSHAAGLIALSGGPEGPVGNLLVNGQD
ncbi:MAG: PHP domain-containing protein, partial [Rhodospirillaceae bacterium]|nr:PHP domain-containing protein [Rhodospirillaceae bacterium]